MFNYRLYLNLEIEIELVFGLREIWAEKSVIDEPRSRFRKKPISWRWFGWGVGSVLVSSIIKLGNEYGGEREN